jgi:hypothetical protein
MLLVHTYTVVYTSSQQGNMRDGGGIYHIISIQHKNSDNTVHHFLYCCADPDLGVVGSCPEATRRITTVKRVVDWRKG